LIRSLCFNRAILPWYLLAFLALGFIFLFLALAAIRLQFPYELEWIEGAKIDQMRWILSGKPLYGPPDIHFIPFAYTPLFFYLSAGLMQWVGIGFAAPRLISILSTTGCFLFIYLIVKRDNGRPIPALIAAGLYAACFALTGAWMDLAKVDSLFMLLILAAFYTSQARFGTVMALTSAALFTLAYFTKQLALPIILIYAPFSLLISRGKTWLVWLIAAVLGISLFFTLDHSSQGWFSFYTLKVITGHTLVPGWWIFWRLLLLKLWPAILLILASLVSSQNGAPPWRWKLPKYTWHCLGFALALLLTSWSIFFKIWTYNNDLMPACAGIAISVGLIAGRAYGNRSALAIHFSGTILKSRSISFQTPIIVLLFLQFICLTYNPIELIPNSKTYQKTEKFITRLASLPGEVFSYQHGFVNYLAGKTTYLHATPLADVTSGAFAPDSETYQRQQVAKQIFKQAIEQQWFDWIIADKFQPAWLPYYIQVNAFMRETEASYPGRYSSIIPQTLLTRNPIVHGGRLALDDARLDRVFSCGWGAPQAGERWTYGAQATLAIALESQTPYELRLTVRPDCPAGVLGVARMQAIWNLSALGDLIFRSCDPVPAVFTIPADSLRLQDYNRLSFIFRNCSGIKSLN